MNNKVAAERAEEEVLADLHLIRNGSVRVTKQSFRNALKRSIGATADYADGCWVPFQDSPLHYICSRSHKSQQLELVRLCWKLGKECQRERKEMSTLSEQDKQTKIDFSCRVCGAPCDTAPDPPDRAVCPKHCEDHDYVYQRDLRGTYCNHCGQEAPQDYYDD